VLEEDGSGVSMRICMYCADLSHVQVHSHGLLAVLCEVSKVQSDQERTANKSRTKKVVHPAPAVPL